MAEEAATLKRKRKELRGEGGVEDTDDEAELARRWAQSLVPQLGQVEPTKTSDSVAVWYPRHRVAVVIISKGKMLSSMGVTGVGGQLLLLAEEALYLAERSYLTLYDGGEATLATFFEAAVDSARRLATTADMYGALTESAGVPLPCFLAYRTLRDQGFVVRRPASLLVIRTEFSVSRGSASSSSSSSSSSKPALQPHWSSCRVNPSQPLPRLPLYHPSVNLDVSAIAFEAFSWYVTLVPSIMNRWLCVWWNTLM